jgi:hypothetical protein
VCANYEPPNSCCLPKDIDIVDVDIDANRKGREVEEGIG